MHNDEAIDDVDSKASSQLQSTRISFLELVVPGGAEYRKCEGEVWEPTGRARNRTDIEIVVTEGSRYVLLLLINSIFHKQNFYVLLML